jgi:NhaP-type Na+/H+ and K+/H+ antiporter
MAVFMSAAMAAVMVVINVGLNSHFFSAWLPSFGIGFVVSLPFAFFLPPLIQKVMMKLHI